MFQCIVFVNFLVVYMSNFAMATKKKQQKIQNKVKFKSRWVELYALFQAPQV